MLCLQDLRRYPIAVLIAGICLGGGAQAMFAASDVDKALSNPQMAAAVRLIERRLAGNQDTWYVVVLRSRDHGIKRLETVLVLGRTAAAVRIAKFLRQNPRVVRNPESYKQWLYVETFKDQAVAEMRYEAVNDYLLGRGYR
jgi:hypothetical protein